MPRVAGRRGPSHNSKVRRLAYQIRTYHLLLIIYLRLRLDRAHTLLLENFTKYDF